MAYLDLSALDGIATVSSERRLDAVERSAVLLSRRDDLSSMTAATRSRRAVELIFGLRPANRLADVRLEALRRFAVAMAHGKNRLVEWERTELRTLKFTEAQIEEARQLALTQRRDRRTGIGIQAAFATAMLAAYLLVRSWVDDATIAAFVVALVGLPVWVAIAPRGASIPLEASSSVNERGWGRRARRGLPSGAAISASAAH